MNVRLQYSQSQLDRIPKTGGLLVVANHPLAGVDAIALAEVISRARPDVKVMVTKFFQNLKQLQGYTIFANTMGGDNSATKAAATAWLREGHVLIIFPAGDVSYRHSPHEPAQDPEWQKGRLRSR